MWLNLLRAGRLHVAVKGFRPVAGRGSTARAEPESADSSTEPLPPTLVNVRIGMRHRPTRQYTSTDGWTESFSFDFTYHEHLFWNLQIDVYQWRALRPRQHFGRYEARLCTLEQSPPSASDAKYAQKQRSAHPL